MDRRDFLAAAGAAAGAMAAGVVPAARARAAEAPATNPRADRMKVGCQRWGSSPEMMPFLRRCGVRNICASPAKTGPDGLWTVETLTERKRQAEAFGMSVDLMYLGFSSIVLGEGDRRDREIEKVRTLVRRAGEARIPGLQYNLHVRAWKPRTGRAPGRGGSEYSAWNLAKAEDRRPRVDVAGLGPDAMWERITHFLERVVPVATEAKVRLAFHPPDPPIPAKNRWDVAQVLDTVEGMQRFVETCASPYHGLNFCQGTFSEMLRDPAREIFDVIRWFGSRGTIFNVHFRNLRGGRDKFVEVYPDEGDVDMARAVRTYKEVGYTGMLMPDHVPRHPEDDTGQRESFAFAYGYIKGLIDAVLSEG